MGTSDQNQPLIKAMEMRIDKVGIVVRDAVKSAKRYSEMLQLDAWSFYDLEFSLTVLEDQPLAGTPCGVRMASNRIGKMQIDLLQPLYGPSSYLSFLQEKGEGIHHLGFGEVAEYDQFVATLRAGGVAIEMQGSALLSGAEGIDFCLFGSRQELGIAFGVTKPSSAGLEPWGTYQAEEPGWIPSVGKKIGQIGIVTHDAEEMARRYWQLLGIGPWALFEWKPPVGEMRVFRGVPVREGTDSCIRAAIVDHPNLQFELLEPVSGPGTHMDYQRSQGTGAHHLSFDIIDDYDQVEATFAAHGVEIEMSGLAGPAYLYTYWSTQEDLGTCLEAVVFYPEEDESAGIYGMYPPEHGGTS